MTGQQDALDEKYFDSDRPIERREHDRLGRLSKDRQSGRFTDSEDRQSYCTRRPVWPRRDSLRQCAQTLRHVVPPTVDFPSGCRGWQVLPPQQLAGTWPAAAIRTRLRKVVASVPRRE